MLKFKNDSQRLVDEHKKLKSTNSGLFDLIEQLISYVSSKYKKDVIITMIYRTQEEQDKIYANDEKYKQKKFKSPHQLWHSVDIRSFIFTKREITELVDYINLNFNAKNWYKWTAKCHEVQGNGEHFHIQFLNK